MRLLKKIALCLVIVLITINLIILITGKLFIYKAIGYTYFKGRVTAGIDEYPIFQNRKVEAGEHQPWPVSMLYNTIAPSVDEMAEFEHYKTIAYLIVKDDSIRFERYWESYNEDSRTSSFSMAKSIVSILTGIAIQEGKIKNVHDPLSDYVKLVDEKFPVPVTIEHLLKMSSGINYDESYLNPFGFPAEAYYGDDLRGLLSKYRGVAEPGKYFEYRSGNTQLLAFVLRKATGMSVSQYASEKLWEPLGAKNPALWSLDHADGDEKAYCCFNSNARDFARIGQLYLNNGNWKGKQIVSEEWVKKSLTIADELIDEKGYEARYGYSWWLMKRRNYDIFYARGILGQYIIGIKELNMVIVRLGRKREFMPAAHPSDVYLYIDAALDMVGG